MRYLGNKTRLSKQLIPILSKHLNKSNTYLEPFSGACGMIQGIDHHVRIANDSDYYIVSLMQSLSVNGGDIFDDLTIDEKLYNQVKNNQQNYPSELVAFLGYGCSFGGKWFGGYARGGLTSKGEPRGYAAESLRNIKLLAPKLKGIVFGNTDYEYLEYGDGNVIYCDIPYRYTAKYKQGEFNYEKFFSLMREVSLTNYVYISEYSAPNDFVSLWSKEHKIGIHRGFNKHKKSVENLFTFRKGLVMKYENI